LQRYEAEGFSTYGAANVPVLQAWTSLSLMQGQPLPMGQLGQSEAFADSFQKLYERCQQCDMKDGDYFEGQ
jgi:hypothetical protein